MNHPPSYDDPPRGLASPIFLVGAVRSGTTMFRLMLNHHSQVAWGHEFEAAVAFLGESGWMPKEQYWEALSTHRAFLAQGFQVDRSLEYPDLVRDFLRQAQERDGRPEVLAAIHSRFHRCPDLWPDARYLHLVRDPRDVARSCVSMGWAGNVYHGAATWVEAAERWERLVQRTRPEQRLEVRYEDLVADPPGVLAETCRFLGLAYEPGMLDYDQDSSYEKPDPRLLGRWRTGLSRRDLRRIEARCGSRMASHGYQPTVVPPRPPGAAERAYLAVDHRVRRALFSVHRYGPRLWLLEKVARVLRWRRLHKTLTLRQNEIDRRHLR